MEIFIPLWAFYPLCLWAVLSALNEVLKLAIFIMDRKLNKRKSPTTEQEAE